MPKVRESSPKVKPGLGYMIRPESPLSRHAALSALNGTSFIYAMRLPGGFIKLGYSAHLATRVRQLHGELLAIQPGDLDDEKVMHDALHGQAAFGREYYPATSDVMAVVNEMRESCGLTPITA